MVVIFSGDGSMGIAFPFGRAPSTVRADSSLWVSCLSRMPVTITQFQKCPPLNNPNSLRSDGRDTQCRSWIAFRKLGVVAADGSNPDLADTDHIARAPVAAMTD